VDVHFIHGCHHINSIQIDADALPVQTTMDRDHAIKHAFNVQAYISAYRRATAANGYPDQYRPMHVYCSPMIAAGLAAAPHHDMSYAERQAVVMQLARGLLGPFALDMPEEKDSSWRPW
jgi:hypothetical protein